MFYIMTPVSIYVISWHLYQDMCYIMTPVSRYVLYHDTCIKICVISWHLCQICVISWHLCQICVISWHLCQICVISWHLYQDMCYMMTPVSRYVLYHDTCVNICVISWHLYQDMCYIITPVFSTCPAQNALSLARGRALVSLTAVSRYACPYYCPVKTQNYFDATLCNNLLPI